MDKRRQTLVDMDRHEDIDMQIDMRRNMDGHRLMCFKIEIDLERDG